MDWFVCRVKAHALAIISLRQQNFEVYAPVVPVEVFRHHKLYRQRRPLFGPYILISFDLEKDLWQKVNTTMGVVHLLPRHREIPYPVPDDYVPKLKALEASKERDFLDAACDITRGYTVGEYVDIKRGHMAGNGGTLIGYSKREMVILLTCMNRWVRAKIPPACVDPKIEVKDIRIAD